jgi:hypothetical protein
MKPLKTLKGSRIWYSKFGVGKQVSSKIYFHKSVWDKIVPKDVWDKAQQIMQSLETEQKLWQMGWTEFEYEIVCYDLNNPKVIRFDGCPGFNLQNEPTVGWMMFVDTEIGSVSFKYNQQIYHHKWLWVSEDYEGFDVGGSYEWSKRWLSRLPEVASGYRHKWEEQLRKYDII